MSLEMQYIREWQCIYFYFVFSQWRTVHLCVIEMWTMHLRAVLLDVIYGCPPLII